MKAAAVGMALVLQLAAAGPHEGAEDPTHQPYQKQVVRQMGRGGQTCVVLDATVLAHTASRANNDLRIESPGRASAREVPFALTESSAEPGDTEAVAVSGERVRGDAVDFDLHMPSRPYSEIDLLTGLKDFTAMAGVTGAVTQAGPYRPMGTLTLFDFSQERLPASLALHLGESQFPWVHIAVRFRDGRGGPFKHPLTKPVFTGAEVPPSRQAQVLYSPVAQTATVDLRGNGSVAELTVPAHVPVERVRIELDPRFKGDFAQKLRITANGENAESPSPEEIFTGEIGRVSRLNVGPGVPPIRYEQLTVPVALGVNLRAAARVRVQMTERDGGPAFAGTAEVAKGHVPVLIRAVSLEMRRRSLCFEAVPDAHYVLRYGDPSLRAPTYEYARLFLSQREAQTAALGPEERNPHYRQSGTGRGFLTRSPELVWVGLIAVVALAGVVTMERLRRHDAGHSRKAGR